MVRIKSASPPHWKESVEFVQKCGQYSFFAPCMGSAPSISTRRKPQGRPSWLENTLVSSRKSRRWPRRGWSWWFCLDGDLDLDKERKMKGWLDEILTSMSSVAKIGLSLFLWKWMWSKLFVLHYLLLWWCALQLIKSAPFTQYYQEKILSTKKSTVVFR